MHVHQVTIWFLLYLLLSELLGSRMLCAPAAHALVCLVGQESWESCVIVVCAVYKASCQCVQVWRRTYLRCAYRASGLVRHLAVRCWGMKDRGPGVAGSFAVFATALHPGFSSSCVCGTSGKVVGGT